MNKWIGWFIGGALAILLIVMFHPALVVCFFLGLGLSGYGMALAERS